MKELLYGLVIAAVATTVPLMYGTNFLAENDLPVVGVVSGSVNLEELEEEAVLDEIVESVVKEEESEVANEVDGLESESPELASAKPPQEEAVEETVAEGDAISEEPAETRTSSESNSWDNIQKIADLKQILNKENKEPRMLKKILTKKGWSESDDEHINEIKKLLKKAISRKAKKAAEKAKSESPQLQEAPTEAKEK